MHVSIFVFIDTYQFICRSATLEEIAGAYMKRYQIDESLYSVNSIVHIYYRVQKDLVKLQQQKDQIKSFPIATAKNGKKTAI